MSADYLKRSASVKRSQKMKRLRTRRENHSDGAFVYDDQLQKSTTQHVLPEAAAINEDPNNFDD